ncbi:uncharacterized protein LOC129720045 [Wyeomyia smithii]|uniref:uncharacterized protein LOC129720045 n=1 Tax=Wyeomyia smithii TaxID=174621 RepID=UPI002467F5E1|nr:uncharacterized protein LOC129720045 [Wyeomyia smithii]
MRAKLLHFGGPALQLIFKNLKGHDHVPLVTLQPKWYDLAVERLDEFFEPRHQSTSERRKLRSIKQKSGERFADFIIRLKQQVSECGFEKYGWEISQILCEIYLTDAVVEGCSSNEVRRIVLMKELSFPEIEALGIAQESVDKQVEDMSPSQPPGKVFKVEQVKHKKGQPVSQYVRSSEKSCYNCGRPGHIAISAACPARGKQCRNCKSYGHFAMLCRKTRRHSMGREPDKRVQVIDEV